MHLIKYQELLFVNNENANGNDCPNREKRRDRALGVAFLMTAVALALSLALAMRRPLESVPPNTGVLDRPDPYIGIERVQFPENTTFPAIVTFPRAIFQITNSDTARMLREDDRQWMSKFGSVVPEDHHFVASSTESSVVQFYAADWGMERCVLHLSLPPTVLTGGSANGLDVWRLDSDKELVPHISWKQAPRRQEPQVPQHFVAGQSTSTIEFTCARGSFPTFEIRCSPNKPSCAVDVWQDKARSADTGVYLVQHWSKS